jgi:dTDP-glucose 4,6-dehydratase
MAIRLSTRKRKIMPAMWTRWENARVYDEAKRFAESLTMAYHRLHGVDTRIVRIFNTYGPRMDLEDGRALPNLLKQALLGQPLTVYGDGGQTRLSVMWMTWSKASSGLLYSDEHMPVNIGNPHEMTILTICGGHQPHHRQQGRGHLSRMRQRPRVTPSAAGRISPAPATILGWEPKCSWRKASARRFHTSRKNWD